MSDVTQLLVTIWVAGRDQRVMYARAGILCDVQDRAAPIGDISIACARIRPSKGGAAVLHREISSAPRIDDLLAVRVYHMHRMPGMNGGGDALCDFVAHHVTVPFRVANYTIARFSISTFGSGIESGVMTTRVDAGAGSPTRLA